jgi:hypothetical protein
LTNEIRYVRAIWNGDLIVNRKKVVWFITFSFILVYLLFRRFLD